MESSFEKGYARSINADGSIVLTYKAHRVGAHFQGAAIVLSMSCWAVLTFLVIGASLKVVGSASTNVFVCAVIAFVLTMVLGRKLVNVTSKMMIKPGEGIIFDGKQLPFSDMHRLGTSHETTLKNANGTAYVYAESYGKEIRLTKNISVSLAKALSDEIKQASGLAWS